MDKIEKYRKTCKWTQTGGMIAIIAIGMVLMLFGFKDSANFGNVITILLMSMLVMLCFMMFVGAPMQNHLVKLVILASLDGLVENVTFNKKKGYTKEAFSKLDLAPDTFEQYICQDYYSFDLNDLFIESATIKAFDTFKVKKHPEKKRSRNVKKTRTYFFGRIYIVPLESEYKFNIYGKRHSTDSRKKILEGKSYCNEYPLKFKKYFENFEVYYKDEKPDNTYLHNVLERLLSLKMQAHGPVHLFVRKNNLIICIDNDRYYEEIDYKKPVPEGLVRDYRKDVSMVTGFINAMTKIEK